MSGKILSYLRLFVSKVSRTERFMPYFFLATGIMLFLSITNKTLLAIAVLLLVGVWVKYRDWLLAFWTVFLIFMPFEKGKSWEITLIPASVMVFGKPYIVYLSVYFSDILFVCLAGLTVWKYYKSKRNESLVLVNKPVMGIVIVLFLTFCLLSLVSSGYPLVSAYSFIRLFVRVAVLWLASAVLRSHIKARELFVYAIAFIVCFQGCLATAQYVLGRPLGRAIEPQGQYFTAYGFTASEDSAFYRVSGTMDHPNSLGLFLVMGVVFITGYTVVGGGKRGISKRLCYSSIVFGLLGIVFSGSRVSWVVLLVCLVPIVFRLKLAEAMAALQKRIWVVIVSVGVCACLVFAVVVPRVGHYAATAGPTGGFFFRTYLIEKAFFLVADNPFGIGLGTYPAVLVERFGFPFWPTPVHNLLVEILVEAGVMALVMFILIVVYVYLEYFRNQRKTALQFSAMLAVSGFLLGSQFYPFFNSSWLLSFFWLMVAAMLY